MKTVKKALLVTVGFISLILGIIGIALPILPTVPFLLLTSYCFVKGSDRFDRWFKGTKIYKNHLEEYVESRSMTLKQKCVILLMANTMLAFPFFMVDVLPMRIFIIVLVIFKLYYFIFRVKTIEVEKGDKINKKVIVE